MNKTIRPAIVLLAAAALAPARAEPPVIVEGEPAPTARIAYADLNLATTAGIEVLNGRIARAARDLCGTSGTVPLHERIEESRCVREALADAQRQVRQVLAANRGERFAERGPITVRLPH